MQYDTYVIITYTQKHGNLLCIRTAETSIGIPQIDYNNRNNNNISQRLKHYDNCRE